MPEALQTPLAAPEDLRASQTGKGFGEITETCVCRMINPGWIGPGKAHVSVQQAAACRVSQNKRSGRGPGVRVLDESSERGCGLTTEQNARCVDNRGSLSPLPSKDETQGPRL